MKRFEGQYRNLKTHYGLAAEGSFIGVGTRDKKTGKVKWIINNTIKDADRFKAKLDKIMRKVRKD